MQNKVQVAGVLRIEAFCSRNIFKKAKEIRKFKKKLRKKLGRVVTYVSPEKVWEEYKKSPQDFTPTGREGGIEYFINTVNHFGTSAEVVVSIHASLLDYESPEEIKKWFLDII